LEEFKLEPEQTTHSSRLIKYMLPVIIWVAILFYFSNQPFQVQDVQPLLARVIGEDQLRALLPPIEFQYGSSLISSQEPYRFVQFFIRKGTHVVVYGVLGLLVLRLAIHLAGTRLKAILYTLYLVGAVAYLDEYNQGLNPNRTGSFNDVVLDMAGALLGIAIYLHWQKSSKYKGE
jgi:VanZ family protein